MKFAYFLLALVSVVLSNRSREAYFVDKWYSRTAQDLIEVISLPQIPERYLSGKEEFRQNATVTKPVLRFDWSNCGQASDPISIQKLEISPDPLVIPGNVVVTVNGSSSIDIIKPFQVDLVIKKKVAFFWVEIPCLDQVGSCTYSDFCPFIQQFLSPCPAAFIKSNVPCSCPFAKGHYEMDKGTIPIASIPIPSWLSSGDYKLNFKASQKGTELVCLNFDITLD